MHFSPLVGKLQSSDYLLVLSMADCNADGEGLREAIYVY